MGQEERKNKAKLEKTQIQLATTSNEYEAAVKALEETTGRWNRDWKAACDVRNDYIPGFGDSLTGEQKFQDLEEERLDFTKSSLWTFANIASTVCVSDDAVSTAMAVLATSLTGSSRARRYAFLWRIAKSRRISPTSYRRGAPVKRYRIPPNISTSVAVISMTAHPRPPKMKATQSLNSNALSILPSEAPRPNPQRTSRIMTRSPS